jgi:HlyD family secretion protein
MNVRRLLLLLPMLCCACSSETTSQNPMETVVVGPVRLQIETEGEIRSAQATPLSVPGQQWTRRQPIWLLADGSAVAAGDLIARFSPEQSELELAQIIVDLHRNQLSRIGKEQQLGGAQARVDIDLVEVATRLSIAERYADIDLAKYFANNEILDAIDDKRFLGVRQGVLEWKRDQSAQRGTTEIAVLDAQKSSHERNAAARKADLNALELRAPHAGMFMLAADWAGEKPRVGINLMAGQALGHLPNLESLEVEIKLPQMEGQAVEIGQKVRLHPIGRPDQPIETKISWVAASAQVRSRENPARFLAVRAPLPPDAVRTMRLTPEMRMIAQIDVLNSDRAISVANVAVLDESGRSVVHVRGKKGFESRQVELGARGIARSEVVKGLSDGDVVLLTPPRALAASQPTNPEAS